MHDDESAGNALAALAGEPVPMATTSVDEVIRKGKRRLRVQRVATVGGVAAVVAVIAAGTLLLQLGAPGSTVPVASRPSAPTTTNALSGYTPVVPPPGPGGDVRVSTIAPPVSTGEVPPTGPSTTTTTKLPMTQSVDACGAVLLTPAQGLGLPMAKANQSFLQAYFTATRHNPVALRSTDRDGVERPDTVLHRAIIEDKTGELVLDIRAHSGTAQEAANEALGPAPECASPRRKTLADGTVLQLYARGSRAQILQVFAPSGRTYLLSLIPDTGWPMSEEQLAVVGDEVAKLG